MRCRSVSALPQPPALIASRCSGKRVSTKNQEDDDGYRHCATVRTIRARADEITYAAVAALPPGEATKERPTLFKNMVGTLNDNYLIDRVWQAHLEGRDHGFTARNLVLHADLAELWAAQQAMTRWYIDWAAAQSEASLEEQVRFRFIGGEESAMRCGAIAAG